MKRLILTICLCVILLHAQPSYAALVDFESIPGITAMPNIATDPIPTAAKLYDQLASLGVLFTCDSSYVPVVRLGLNHATSGYNGIGGSTSNSHLTYDGNSPVVLTFVYPGNPSIPAVTDFVSIRGDLWGDANDSGTLEAYDIYGAPITSDTVINTGGQIYQISAPGIHTVEFVGTVDSRGIALDDLCFNTPVPEPATICLLGLGTLSLLRRKREA